jgi:hypothetical protein
MKVIAFNSQCFSSSIGIQFKPTFLFNLNKTSNLLKHIKIASKWHLRTSKCELDSVLNCKKRKHAFLDYKNP